MGLHGPTVAYGPTVNRSGNEYQQYDDGHVGPVSTVMCYPMPDGTHIIISCGSADHSVSHGVFLCIYAVEVGGVWMCIGKLTGTPDKNRMGDAWNWGSRH